MIKNVENFKSFHYQRHNKRRQEHLASLGLPIAEKSVLEVGAGIGDHTSFFIDQGCSVTSTDGRLDLLEILKFFNPKAHIMVWDVEKVAPAGLEPSQIVYAYGLLYHTQYPDTVLQNLSALCTEYLLLETCVSFGSEELINITEEVLDDPTQALGGFGCRPTRSWVFNQLQKLFPHVYLTKTQPWHEEFPIIWERDVVKIDKKLLTRSIFVASRYPMDNEKLVPHLLDRQIR